MTGLTIPMCGRFVGYSTAEQIQSHFQVDQMLSDHIQASYNIAPQQELAVVTQEGSERILSLMHWGLVPFWAKDPSIGNRMINARSETLAEKPAFKSAFRNRRCLIVNDGFFEWKGPKRDRQPVFLKPKGQEGPFAFAGLWEAWKPKDDEFAEEYRSCTILTADSSESVRPIHHRMPIVLKPFAYGTWLDPSTKDPTELYRIMDDHYWDFENHPVSKEVNSPVKNAPSLIAKINHKRP